MDSDTDESLEDFKSPKNLSARGKQGSPKQIRMKQRMTKNDEKNDSPSLSVQENKQSQAKSKVLSFDSNVIQKKRTRGKVISPARNEASLSPGEKKECSRCPTCGKIFRIKEIIKHAADCLRKNFAVCKGSRENFENVSSNSNVETGAESLGLSSENFLCISCGCDLTGYSADQKNIHMNRCLDSGVPSETSAVKSQKQHEKKVGQSVNCPFCLKVVTQRGLKRHLVACQKKNKFSTMTAMALHRPEGEGVDDELLSEIRESDRRPHAMSVEKKVVKTKGKKPSMKKNRETYQDEMMQLAIAVSNDEDLEKKKPRMSRKKQQEVIIPLMITLSPNSKRKQLRTRLDDIAHPERFNGDDDEIPSTPVLPATSLTLSNISLISSLQSRQPFADDESPGPSGIGTHFGHRNLHSNNQLDEGKDVPQCSSSITCSGPSVSSPKPCTDELQSPEVSSSNIKSTTSFDNCGNLVTSGSEASDVSRNTSDAEHGDGRALTQKSVGRSPPLDIWAVTKSPTPTRPLYHVPGLLSQFDESKKKLMATLSEPNDEMNSTLTTLNTLDKDCSEADYNSAEAEQKRVESGRCVPEQSNASQKQQVSSSQPVSSFVKLIDNRQFSDAKILAGRDKEVIYLHKNILFCCCPLLLEEIIGCDDDELLLEDYEKSAILPLIAYIYSRRIESLLAAASTEHYLKTSQLMEKFGVTLTDCHKRMLDAAIEDNTKCQKTSFHSKMKDVSVNRELEFVSSKAGSENCLSLAEDYVNITQSKEANHTSPTSSVQTSVKDETDEASYSSSTLNTSITVKSSHILPSPQTPCTDRNLHDSPTKPRKRSKPTLDTRKSLRQVSNTRIRKRHSDWKTRRCPCCTEKEIDLEDKIPRLHDNWSTPEKRRHRKRRLCQLHQQHQLDLRKKICLGSPKKEQKVLSPLRYGSKFSDGVTSPRRQRYLRRLSLSKLPKNKQRRSTSRSISKRSKSGDVPMTRRTRSSDMLEKKVNKPHMTFVDDSSSELKQSGNELKETEAENESAQSANNTCFLDKNDGDITVNQQESTSKQDKNSITPKAHNDDELHRYVTERLPRFKQREYIKNRPGVANMGKSSNKILKVSKKAAVTPAKTAPDIEENAVQDCVSSKTESLPCFYSDEEMADDKLFGDNNSCVALASYAFPSPKSLRNMESVKCSTMAVESDDDSSSLSDIFLDSSFGNQWTPSTAKQCDTQSNYPSTPPLFSTTAEPSQPKKSYHCSHPLWITPMPNYNGMPTPELLRRAKDIGLKQRIGKSKIRAKLEEVFLYHHQVSSDQEFATEEVEQKEDKSADEDDLRISNIDENSTKLKLSAMSAMSDSRTARNSVYSFSLLAKDKVLGLSTAVVDAMHVDGTLWKALQEMKEKTGSIKRGSQQDQKRCWAMVTPGSSAFNVKLDAILRLPEDYITAITSPFVACVVKYYIDLKKYQFDCLPAVCDRMEEWFRATEGEGRTNTL